MQRIKIAVLANPDSVHTRKWIASLCSSDFEIVLISLHRSDTAFYNELPNFKIYSLGFSGKLNYLNNKISKLKYIFTVKEIKRILSVEKPDILHSYYASSFGLIGALCNFHPYVISVWGSDIFDFPKSSFVAKKILKYNLSRADHIMATSNALAEETKKYSSKKMNVIPFGVDTKVFFRNRKRILFDDNDIVVGSIKTLEKVYGIDFLIKAFAKLNENNDHLSLKLLLVGSGSCENKYKTLVEELGIMKEVVFAGRVDHSEIVKYYNEIDIFAVPSIMESFGVSALEASACELPVVASDTGGLPEVVIDKSTGFIVPVGDTDAIANSLERLIADKNLRLLLGKNGRQFVIEKYSWSNCLEKMTNTYREILPN